MYRLFVAIDLPDGVKEALTEICRDLPGGRRVPVEQLHLTLRFIGEADEGLYQGIKNRLAAIKAAPFPMAMQGIGHFPPGKRARVLWVGVDGGEPLPRLQQQVETALTGAGVLPEERGFSPHITLARFRDPWPGNTAAMEARHAAFTTTPFPVTAFHLYSSVLTRDGAIHRCEATYPLTTP